MYSLTFSLKTTLAYALTQTQPKLIPERTIHESSSYVMLFHLNIDMNTKYSLFSILQLLLTGFKG